MLRNFIRWLLITTASAIAVWLLLYCTMSIIYYVTHNIVFGP